MSDGLNMSRRIRRTPYTDRVEAHGVRGFSVVNHMLLPKAYQPSVEDDYWHLREHVQIWDVSCQRQVEISGPDAAQLVQLMTPRDLRCARVGQCLYVTVIDGEAGLINDPVLLKLADDRFWLSIADSDVLLFAKGIALGRGFNVQVFEPDVSPLAIQGPKAERLLCDLFGPQIADIGFFKFAYVDFDGSRQLIARSGYSRQGGFEIYLDDSALGAKLWDAVWAAGVPYEIRSGCPNLIERIEGGLLSFGNEMTNANNPLELRLENYCSLDGEVDYLGRAALQAIATKGAQRKICGVRFGGGPGPQCAIPWPVLSAEAEMTKIGQITSSMWSPRLQANVGLSLIERGYWHAGQAVRVSRPDGVQSDGVVCALPFDAATH